MLSIYLAMLEDDDDKSRFEELYEKYNDYLIKFAYAKLNDNALVITAVDNALISIARNIKSIPYDAEKTYICQIIKNATINEINKFKKATYVDYYPDDYIFVENNTPEDDLIYKEALEKLTECLRKMPENTRDILTLKYVCEMTPKEISLILDVSINTVKSIIKRTKSTIAKELK